MKRKNLADHFKSNPWGIQAQIFNIKPDSENILGIDVGGTKTLIGFVEKNFFEHGGRTMAGIQDVSAKHYFENEKFTSLNQIIQEYLRNYNLNTAETSVCIAGAGPLQNNAIQMSNRGWAIRSDEITNNFGFKRVYLINDLEATIYAIDAVDTSHLVTLNLGKKNQQGNVAVISAGTGLGESIGITIDNNGYRMGIATEGGNADFAPADDLEIDLLRFLKAQQDHVSWEDILSGRGMQRIYEFLLQSGQEMNEQTSIEMQSKNPAEVITERGLSGVDSVCRRALEVFVSIYGSEAGNLALKCLPYAGIYISGGIAPRLLQLIEDGSFMKRFLSKGKLGSLLEKIPVYLITNSEYSLVGAINYAIINLPVI